MKFGIKSSYLLLAAYLIFVVGTKNLSSASAHPEDVPGSVVIPAPLQTILYFGDPYLAANIEAVRVLATGGPAAGIAEDYFDRLQMGAAVLNPCHEDNYYTANAIMAWAGSVDGAIAILRGATDCRFWDEMPPFFLGYNLHFFKRENLKAKDALFQAAARSNNFHDGFLRIGILYGAQSYADPRDALQFLAAQRDESHDPKWKQLLDQRIERLVGLITLQEAQATYERRFGHPLQDANALLTSAVLKQFPIDPVRLGYVFEDGRFALREVKIPGLKGPHK